MQGVALLSHTSTLSVIDYHLSFDMSLSVESTPSPPLSPGMLTTKHKVVHKVVLTGGKL